MDGETSKSYVNPTDGGSHFMSSGSVNCGQQHTHIMQNNRSKSILVI